MAEQKKTAQSKRIVDVTTPEGSRALREALKNLKGDHTPIPTEEFHEFKNLRDKLLKK